MLFIYSIYDFVLAEKKDYNNLKTGKREPKLYLADHYSGPKIYRNAIWRWDGQNLKIVR